jgi:hypothetical protein
MKTAAHEPEDRTRLEGLRLSLKIRRDVPVAPRIVHGLDKLVVLAVVNPVMAFVIDLAASAVLIIVISAKARHDSGGLWFDVVVFLLLAAVWLGIGTQIKRTLPVLTLFIDGRPTFGELGGGPTRLLRAAIRASTELRFELAPNDVEVMDRLAALDLKITADFFRERFVELAQKQTEPPDEGEIDSEWKTLWEGDLLGYRSGKSTLREAFGAPSYALQIVPHRLPAVRNLVLPLFYIYQVVLMWLVYRLLSGSGSLLTILQVGLAFSVLLSMLILVNHSTGLERVEILDTFPEKYREEASGLVGVQVEPVKVSVTAGYFSLVRGYFARAIAVLMGYNALIGLLLLGISLAAGLVAASGRHGELLTWYGELAAAFVLIPVGMLAGFYIAWQLVQSARRLVAVAIGALVTALVPFALNYIASGNAPRGTSAILAGAITVAVASLATGIGAQTTRSLSAAEA